MPASAIIGSFRSVRTGTVSAPTASSMPSSTTSKAAWKLLPGRGRDERGAHLLGVLLRFAAQRRRGTFPCAVNLVARFLIYGTLLGSTSPKVSVPSFCNNIFLLGNFSELLDTIYIQTQPPKMKAYPFWPPTFIRSGSMIIPSTTSAWPFGCPTAVTIISIAQPYR